MAWRPVAASAALPLASDSEGDKKVTAEVNQWGITTARNNVAVGHNIPTEWKLGKFNLRTGEWDPKGSKNIKWVAKLGSQIVRQSGRRRRQGLRRHQQLRRLAEPLPVERRPRLPARVRPQGRQVSLAAFEREAAHRPRPRLAAAGHLLRPAGRRRAALVRHQPRRSPLHRHRGLPRRRERRPLQRRKSHERRRSRRHLGLRHDEGDGHLAAQHVQLLGHGRRRLALRQHFERRRRRAQQHPRSGCAQLLRDGQEHGKVLWTDKSPGLNILHGQWSSPTYGVLGGVPQVIFAGGDGWVYSFAPEGDGKGNAKLLWKFDANPKDGVLHRQRQGHAQPHHRHAGDLRRARLRRRRRGSRARRRHRPPLVHRSHEARRRFARAGLQLERPLEADSAQAAAGRRRGRGRLRPAESELRRRLALCLGRHQRRRQDRIRRNHASHRRHRRHQGQHPVHRRFQRPVPLPRRQDRQSPLGRTTCSPPPGARR